MPNVGYCDVTISKNSLRKDRSQSGGIRAGMLIARTHCEGATFFFEKFYYEQLSKKAKVVMDATTGDLRLPAAHGPGLQDVMITHQSTVTWMAQMAKRVVHSRSQATANEAINW